MEETTQALAFHSKLQGTCIGLEGLVIGVTLFTGQLRMAVRVMYALPHLMIMYFSLQIHFQRQTKRLL